MNARQAARRLVVPASVASFGAMIGTLAGLAGWFFMAPDGPLPLYTSAGLGFIGGSLAGLVGGGIWQAVAQRSGAVWQRAKEVQA